MQTPKEYAKQQAESGQTARIIIQQDAGVFWLFDADWNLLKGRPYETREKASDARHKVTLWAGQFWREPK